MSKFDFGHWTPFNPKQLRRFISGHDAWNSLLAQLAQISSFPEMLKNLKNGYVKLVLLGILLCVYEEPNLFNGVT